MPLLYGIKTSARGRTKRRFASDPPRVPANHAVFHPPVEISRLAGDSVVSSSPGLTGIDRPLVLKTVINAKHSNYQPRSSRVHLRFARCPVNFVRPCIFSPQFGHKSDSLAMFSTSTRARFALTRPPEPVKLSVKVNHIPRSNRNHDEHSVMLGLGVR